MDMIGGVASMAQEVAGTCHTLVALAHHGTHMAVRAGRPQVLVRLLPAPRGYCAAAVTIATARGMGNDGAEILPAEGAPYDLLPHGLLVI